MRLSRRLRDLESRHGGAAADPMAEMGAAWCRIWTAFLELVPGDLRDPLAARLGDPFHADAEVLADWVLAPFARWAGLPSSGYQFPRALVAWVLEPPHPFWFGHHCGSCGLCVPLLAVGCGAQPPLTDLRVFPQCPGCGGTTSHAAGYGPDAAVTEIDR